MSVATAGVPQAAASVSVRPQPSAREPLATTQAQWSDGWLHGKLLLVVLLLACHGILAAHVRRFQGDERPKPATWYRVFNEVPTLLFIGIVLLVVLKPF